MDTWIEISGNSICVSYGQHKHKFIGKETGVTSTGVGVVIRRKRAAP